MESHFMAKAKTQCVNTCRHCVKQLNRFMNPLMFILLLTENCSNTKTNSVMNEIPGNWSLKNAFRNILKAHSMSQENERNIKKQHFTIKMHRLNIQIIV